MAVAQLVEYLSKAQEAVSLLPAPRLIVVVHTGNFNILKPEARGSEAESNLQRLHSEFEVSQDHMSYYLKTTKQPT